MSMHSITIKPNNHRIYQCPLAKKTALINDLINQNSSHSIIVMTSGDTTEIQEALQNKKIQVVTDKELVANKDLSCEFLISYDLPIKAIVYMARVSKATQKAFLLLDQSEQKELHAVETLLGRAIKQEILPEYAYPTPVKEKPSTSYKKMSKEEIKGEAKKRYEAKTQEPPKKDIKPKKDFKANNEKWEKKKKAPNKFLGKDENGKAIFSGKDGERNHRYDGTSKKSHPAPKAAGRKISIKAIKPKEEKKS